ncbi:MAG: AmmeMemoRadiSam system protein A [Anaerolineae bacterium]|jgi:hypothetical protein|nr:AmmeMemoRadiSam system protein A [Anaerolineae bacterium]
MGDPLNDADKVILLALARRTLESVVHRQGLPVLRLKDYSSDLQAPGASFVTLTREGDLRGCIGALEAYQPLVQDVCEHAGAAALEDYRFPPVRAEELPHIQIEISRLTPPQPMVYISPDDLLRQLRPGIDGVILRDGGRRATFLPQVWEKLPDPFDFLSHLCQKMGASPNHWQKRQLEVQIYQVEEFHE